MALFTLANAGQLFVDRRGGLHLSRPVQGQPWRVQFFLRWRCLCVRSVAAATGGRTLGGIGFGDRLCGGMVAVRR
ncbi:hypothetical protein D3C84_891970 [compost metagenome]